MEKKVLIKRINESVDKWNKENKLKNEDLVVISLNEVKSLLKKFKKSGLKKGVDCIILSEINSIEWRLPGQKDSFIEVREETVKDLPKNWEVQK